MRLEDITADYAIRLYITERHSRSSARGVDLDLMQMPSATDDDPGERFSWLATLMKGAPSWVLDAYELFHFGSAGTYEAVVTTSAGVRIGSQEARGLRWRQVAEILGRDPGTVREAVSCLLEAVGTQLGERKRRYVAMQTESNVA